MKPELRMLARQGFVKFSAGSGASHTLEIAHSHSHKCPQCTRALVHLYRVAVGHIGSAACRYAPLR